VDNVPYWAAWDFFGDTGNPGLEAFGINLKVLEQADDGTWGEVSFWLDDDTVFFDKRASVKTFVPGEPITYTITIKDASGTRYKDDFSYTYVATMTDHLPVGATYMPGSLTLIDGPWTTNPSTVTVAGDMIVWNGTIGGNPLHVADAVIQYAVAVSTTSGAIASSAALHVEQVLISTDTFSNPLTVPYLWPKQEVYIASSQVGVRVEEEGDGQTYLPIIHE
jgi:uncharacterized repeat protein (TIGR01451 family)